MANIYISFWRNDLNAAIELSNQLEAFGHRVLAEDQTTSKGLNWRDVLTKKLKRSEIFIPLISADSDAAQWVKSETEVAIGYAHENGRPLIIPVILDDAPLPFYVRQIQSIQGESSDLERVAMLIDAAANNFAGRLAAAEEKQDATRERIEENAAEFINEAIANLTKFERRNRTTGGLWNFLGFLSLVVGLGITYLGMTHAISTINASWPEFTFITIKSILAVAIIGAATKYAFALGKSYTNEALRASDRLHAISFGKFYLQVYGEKADWPEIKEAFAQWNIDRRSSFSEIDASSIDPQVMTVLIEAARAISNMVNRTHPDK